MIRTVRDPYIPEHDAFVRSVRGTRARWYKEVVADPKVTIHADGSQGADTKYKVFWVTGCPTYPPQAPQQVSGLPASLQTDVPKKGTGIDWAIVGFAVVMAAAVMIVARRRTAAKRP